MTVVFCMPVYAKPVWYNDYIESGAIVISKSERKLYMFSNQGDVYEYPIAIGKSATPSKVGLFTVVSKVRNPTWYPPDSIRYENPKNILPESVPPGPKNPLGPRAIYFSAENIRIHGTNKPSSIGKAVTHGCFRMKNEDILKLYDQVDIGMPIYVLK